MSNSEPQIIERIIERPVVVDTTARHMRKGTLRRIGKATAGCAFAASMLWSADKLGVIDLPQMPNIDIPNVWDTESEMNGPEEYGIVSMEPIDLSCKLKSTFFFKNSEARAEVRVLGVDVKSARIAKASAENIQVYTCIGNDQPDETDKSEAIDPAEFTNITPQKNISGEHVSTIVEIDNSQFVFIPVIDVLGLDFDIDYEAIARIGNLPADLGKVFNIGPSGSFDDFDDNLKQNAVASGVNIVMQECIPAFWEEAKNYIAESYQETMRANALTQGLSADQIPKVTVGFSSYKPPEVQIAYELDAELESADPTERPSCQNRMGEVAPTEPTTPDTIVPTTSTTTTTTTTTTAPPPPPPPPTTTTTEVPNGRNNDDDKGRLV